MSAIRFELWIRRERAVGFGQELIELTPEEVGAREDLMRRGAGWIELGRPARDLQRTI
jgi:hypothetical protein